MKYIYTLNIIRGQGSFQLLEIPQDIKIIDLKEKVVSRFNELFPNNLEAPTNWQSKQSIQKIKQLAVEQGIQKDKEKTQELIRNLKLKEQIKRKTMS